MSLCNNLALFYSNIVFVDVAETSWIIDRIARTVISVRVHPFLDSVLIGFDNPSGVGYGLLIIDAIQGMGVYGIDFQMQVNSDWNWFSARNF